MGVAGEVSGVSEEFPRHFRMGYGLGEAAWGIAQIVAGAGGEVGGGVATSTGVGAVVGVLVIVGSTAVIVEGAADVGVGWGVFMSALDEPPATGRAVTSAGRERWVEVREAGRQDARTIIDRHRAAARTQGFESGRHTWHRGAARELDEAAAAAERRGDLPEYVEELRSAAETMRRRAQGHRGGISGRGTR